MRKRRNPDDYALLSIKLSKWGVSVGEAIDLNLRTTVPYSWDESDPVIASNLRLEIAGVCTYPERRANASYEVTLYGDTRARQRLTFDQIHVRDEHHVRMYRKYRGTEYPVFKVPPGLATIERLRGTQEWRGAFFVEPETIDRMLIVLGCQRSLYLSIDEYKVDRQRWVRGFSLQTTDPAAE